MTPIMPGRWCTFITIPSSMGWSQRSVIGGIQRFIVASGSVCSHRIGQVVRCYEPKAPMGNRANNPHAHSAPYRLLSVIIIARLRGKS
jgi:hypothetical protein